MGPFLSAKKLKLAVVQAKFLVEVSVPAMPITGNSVKGARSLKELRMPARFPGVATMAKPPPPLLWGRPMFSSGLKQAEMMMMMKVVVCGFDCHSARSSQTVP
ncbi:unnamed protein product, partial [Iphiclides podalirius]